MDTSNKITGRLHDDVFFLSSEVGERNPICHEKLQQVREWLIRSMTVSNLYPQPRQQIYKVNGKEFANVLLEKTGAKPSLGSIIIGAHYDSAPGTPGADDNASGVAVMLELARHFSKEKTKHTLEFVGFTLEEPPYFRTQDMGSMRLANEWRSEKKKIKLMISLEMVGFFSDDEIQEFPLPGMGFFYPNKGNFIAAIGQTGSPQPVVRFAKLLKQNGGFPAESFFAPRILAGIDFSDHQSFWQCGYPALMITDTAFYRNKNYHQSTDTPDTLNYAMMEKLVRTLIETIKAYDKME